MQPPILQLLGYLHNFTSPIDMSMTRLGVFSGLFFILLDVYWAVKIENVLQNSEIKYFNQVQGPESLAFDPQGRGPYTGVADGRIVFWDENKWNDFAYTSANRTSDCDANQSTFSHMKSEHICGRPLGLRFDKKNGDLYIADAYFGLMKVGPEGGLAITLTTESEGVPFKFTNDLDIDNEGNIYFTDSSTIYQRRNAIQLFLTGEDSGRVLKYNPKTKETNVLVRNLQFPNGLSLSKDGSFFAFCESSGRLWSYWLKGDKVGTCEVMTDLPGIPDNVRTNDDGEFWVAIYGGDLRAMVVKYSPEGKLLKVLEDRQGKVVTSISQVNEKDGKLFMGSVLMPFIAVYQLMD